MSAADHVSVALELAEVKASGDDTGTTDEITNDDTAPKKSVATRLVELALDLFHLHVDDAGAPFAIRKDGPNLALPFRAGSLGMRSHLARTFYASQGRAAPSAALADALTTLEGEAAMTDPAPTHLRTAPHDGGVVLDLGTPDGSVVVIDSTGWRVTSSSPVTFRRTAVTGALPTPVAGGDLEELRDLLNVSDGSWPLLAGWLVATVLPELHHPILSLRGPMGSAKSTTATRLVNLVDPSPAPLRTAPRDAESWVITAASSWVVALDNVSTIAPWMQDALCRAVTGDGLVRRQLYTDSAVTVVTMRRAVILTSIDVGAMRGDLADRLVRVELDRIDGAARRTDAELTENVHRRSTPDPRCAARPRSRRSRPPPRGHPRHAAPNGRLRQGPGRCRSRHRARLPRRLAEAGKGADDRRGGRRPRGGCSPRVSRQGRMDRDGAGAAREADPGPPTQGMAHPGPDPRGAADERSNGTSLCWHRGQQGADQLDPAHPSEEGPGSIVIIVTIVTSWR